MSDRSTVFPFVNMSGLVMYDANGNCTNCGHHADAHHRGCIHRGRWSPAEMRYVCGTCDCWYESPEQYAEGRRAAAAWNAFMGREGDAR